MIDTTSSDPFDSHPLVQTSTIAAVHIFEASNVARTPAARHINQTTMGLLSSLGITSPSPEEKRASEVRSGAVAPTRAERQRCWDSRDVFYACLDAHGIVDAIKDEKKVASVCKKEHARFESDCAAQWVSN